MTIIKKYWLEVLITLSILIFFTIRGQLFIDPDFGWHYRMGELILNQGIPKADPFSYTMPDFPFIDHEWLINIFIFKLFSLFGIWGISFLFALLAILTLTINISQYKRLFFLVSFLMGILIINPAIGIRPQILSWVLFSVLLKILNSNNPKYYLIPLLTLAWVNLHGSFPLSIVIFLIFNVVNVYQTRKLNVLAWIMWVVSILITFINPYGIRIWQEIWQQVTDPTLRSSIQEWFPLLNSFDLGVYYSLIFICFFILKYRQRISLFQSLLFCPGR